MVRKLTCYAVLFKRKGDEEIVEHSSASEAYCESDKYICCLQWINIYVIMTWPYNYPIKLFDVLVAFFIHIVRFDIELAPSYAFDHAPPPDATNEKM